MTTDTTLTPRTDAVYRQQLGNISIEPFRDHANDLERELIAMTADRDRLKAANARHVIAHIERICPACGHTQDEDNQCANCLKNSYDLLRDEFKRIEAVFHGNVMPYAIEITGICQRAVSGIERTVPVTVELERVTAERDRAMACLRVAEEALVKASGPSSLMRPADFARRALAQLRAMKGQP